MKQLISDQLAFYQLFESFLQNLLKQTKIKQLILDKINERVIKDQLVPYLTNYFSPDISTSSQGYITLQILIRLKEEQQKHLDNDTIVESLFVELQMDFDCASRDLIITKITAFSSKRIVLESINSYINDWKQ